MSRWLLIPKIGTGRIGDLYRPKYALDFASVSYKGVSGDDTEGFILCDLSGDEKAIDEIASMPDVEEISNTATAIDARSKARLQAISGSQVKEASGEEFISTLKASMEIKARDAGIRARGVAGAVADAIRGR